MNKENTVSCSKKHRSSLYAPVSDDNQIERMVSHSPGILLNTHGSGEAISTIGQRYRFKRGRVRKSGARSLSSRNLVMSGGTLEKKKQVREAHLVAQEQVVFSNKPI